MKKKIIVIGGGPGGYAAAIRAAQLGADVTVIEKNKMGGTCLNIGCIPTKALLESSHIYFQSGHSETMGVTANPILDWKAVQERKNQIVRRLVAGVESLMRANQIQVIYGLASFKDSDTVVVKKETGEKEELHGDCFIIAAGSEPFVPSVPGIDNEFCIDSERALSLDKIPESMVVVGGGVIGIELATAYHEFGTRITIVEMTTGILPNMDGELSECLKRDMQKQGIQILTGTKLCAVSSENGQACCEVESGGKKEKLYAEKVLICIGRKARFQDLKLENAGVKAGRAIETDSHLRTNQSHIYAVGDCNGRIMLAHAASEQGVVAAENCMGMESNYDGRGCPSGVYSHPEIAGAGLTEEQAKEQGIDYQMGIFPMSANGRALITGSETGKVKILTGSKYGEILGVHIYGAQATELIAEGVLAMKLEATADELIDTIHAHPTLSECIHEAALACENRAIHIPNRKGAGKR